MIDPAWVALSLAEHVGGKKMRALLAHFDGDPRTVLRADAKELQRVPGIGPKIAQNIRALDLAQIESDLPRWQAAGVIVLPQDSPGYPPRLLSIDDLPPTLFARGDWRPQIERAAAVVGTRQPTAQAIRWAEDIGAALAEQGYTVISGLALGIDAAAHRGALSVSMGRTLAVMGGGVLNIYPPQHRSLGEAVMLRGALLAEVHPYAEPKPAHLIARNRLISGLSDLLIVVETGIDGGAMHAARRALDQGRKVYAVDCAASGNRALLAEGALPFSPKVRLWDTL